MPAKDTNLENVAVETSDNSFLNSDKFWWISCLLITAVAIFLRVYWIDLKPLHHDEGVNGFFLTNLFREGVYKYDPANYHGPTLYFFSLAFTKILGLETFAVRYSVGIFGVLMVVLTFALRRYLGTVGTLTAALFLALSPGMVFVSRYFIHEISFVFFTYAMVVGIVLFMEKRTSGLWANVQMAVVLLMCLIPLPLLVPNILGFSDLVTFRLRNGLFLIEALIVFAIMIPLSRWRGGRPIYLILASASCALVFATKETGFISFGTMIIACICIWAYRALFIDHDKISKEWQEPVALTPRTFIESAGKDADAILLITAVVVIFIYINVLFFSSIFTYSEGVGKAFEAYDIWTKTGTKDHADKPFYTYFKWVGSIEGPIMGLSAIGIAIAFWKAQHRFAMFCALWAFGLFAAYTIIPYKTPWLALSFLLPMCLIAGYGINEIVGAKDKLQKIIGGGLVAVAAAVLTYQTIDINFYQYDNEKRTYVYAQTNREFLNLIGRIEEYAEKTKKGKDLSVAVVSPDYWPMPWYMKNYSSVVFHGRGVPANMADLIITSEQQEKDCKESASSTKNGCDMVRNYPQNYEYTETFPLRSGVQLRLWVRKDILGKALGEEPGTAE